MTDRPLVHAEEATRLPRRWRGLCLLVVVLLAVALLPGAASGAITQYPAGSQPLGITTGPDGALWFADGLGNKIGRITTAGDVVEYPIPTADAFPVHIAVGPDGALWFTESSGNRIGRITTGGDVTEFLIPTAHVGPDGITAGPDGALWFTEPGVDQIGRITTDGDITEYPLPTTGSGPADITSGPDGALWFTESGFHGHRIGRITTDGDLTEFPELPVGETPIGQIEDGYRPTGIVAGPDGALWFMEGSPYIDVNPGKIGRITTGGDLTEFELPGFGAGHGRITAGPDGALWFTDPIPGHIGRITTVGELTELPIPGNHNLWGIAAGPDGAVWFTDFFGVSGTVGRIPAPLNSISQNVPAGATVSTNTTANADDPVGTSVTTPVAGTVTIAESPTSTPDPSGYSLLGQQIEITAPAASAAEPLVLRFVLDASVLPPGEDENTVEVFRNGVAIADCDAGAGTSATPDPCVAGRAATAGGIELTVRTSHASAWNFGLAVAPETTITSGPSGTTNDPTPSFAFSSSLPGSSFQCKLDAGTYAACGSPKVTAQLADGPHTFSVRATKNAHTDPTPAARTFTVKTAAVSRSGSTLVVTAAPGAKDNLVITRPSASTLRIADPASGGYTGSGIHVGAGCTRDGDNAANCANAAQVTLIKVRSGDQSDRVRNSTVIKSSLDGGTGNDALSGGSAADTLTGAAGLDVLKGMGGNDLLKARDLASDTVIDCGIGTDKADLDLLPKDPATAVKGCETKTRH